MFENILRSFSREILKENYEITPEFHKILGKI